LRSVAAVSGAAAVPQHLGRFNGRRAVFVTVEQKDGADVGQVTKAVEASLAEFEKTLPAGVKLEKGFVQARNVEHRLNKLYKDFGLALALVLITLLPLGLRAGGVVMLSIPLSLLIGLALLQIFGFTVNQLAISGFVLSLGLLVDDSIVVTENIARHMRMGLGREEAAIAGTRQITLAILGCTATLMFAFLPLTMLPEGSGAYIRSLPVTVICTVGASLVVALTIIPFLASRFLSKHEDPDGNALLRVVNGAIHRFYAPILHRGLARPWLTMGVIAVICATVVPMVGAIGTSLFPPAETPQFLVRIQTADGTAMARTDAALRFVEQRLAARPQIAWTAANLGRGNPQIYYNQGQRETQTSYAEVFTALKEWKPGESPQILDGLRNEFAQYPGARITIVTFENGPPVEAPIAVRLTGDDLGVLKDLAARAEAILKATPGARDVANPLRLDRTDLDLGVDEAKAAALGAPAGAARRIARLALSGEDAARFRDADGDDYPVRVRLPMDGRNELSSLSQLYVPTQGGQAAPLGALAQPKLVSNPARIARFNRERTVTVTSQVQTGFLTSAVTEAAQARLDRELPLPPGYRIAWGGSSASSRSWFWSSASSARPWSSPASSRWACSARWRPCG
jgi:multidrug efflux pump subunit AcrB